MEVKFLELKNDQNNPRQKEDDTALSPFSCCKSKKENYASNRDYIKQVKNICFVVTKIEKANVLKWSEEERCKGI